MTQFFSAPQLENCVHLVLGLDIKEQNVRRNRTGLGHNSALAGLGTKYVTQAASETDDIMSWLCFTGPNFI